MLLCTIENIGKNYYVENIASLIEINITDKIFPVITIVLK